jgi:hypothetical protein
MTTQPPVTAEPPTGFPTDFCEADKSTIRRCSPKPDRRREDFQLRLADRITSFAGIDELRVDPRGAVFTWMLFLERSRGQLLTLVLSLEAIFCRRS